MKKLLYLFLLIGLTSCEFLYLELRFNPCDRILGRHYIHEYSETYNAYTSYSIWIDQQGGYSNEFYIDNFYGSDLRVCASIYSDRITIHRQVVDGYSIEGVGTVYGDDISLNYTVRDLYAGTRTDFCEANSR